MRKIVIGILVAVLSLTVIPTNSASAAGLGHHKAALLKHHKHHHHHHHGK
jgi:hypothetical protein